MFTGKYEEVSINFNIKKPWKKKLWKISVHPQKKGEKIFQFLESGKTFRTSRIVGSKKTNRTVPETSKSCQKIRIGLN